jgi:hypothetical protein
VRYEVGFYIQEETILHSHRRENLKSFFLLFSFAYLQSTLQWSNK